MGLDQIGRSQESERFRKTAGWFHIYIYEYNIYIYIYIFVLYVLYVSFNHIVGMTPMPKI